MHIEYPADYIPPVFNNYSRAILILHNVIQLSGAFLNGILLYSIVKERAHRQRHDAAALVLISALFTWGCVQFITSLLVNVNGGVSRNHFGFIVCQSQGVIVNVLTGVAICAHMLLAMERYSAAILNRKLSWKVFAATFIGNTSIMFAASFAQITATARHFEPMETATWCHFPFTSITSPTDVLPAITIISYMGAAISLLNVVYLRIYIKVFMVTREVADMEHTSEKSVTAPSQDLPAPSSPTSPRPPSPLSMAPHTNTYDVTHSHDYRAAQLAAAHTSPSPYNSTNNSYHDHSNDTTVAPENPSTNRITTNDLQKRVFIRCVVILGSFVSFYSAAFLTMIYRLATRKSIHPAIEFASTLCTMFDLLVTPSLLLYFDADYRAAVKRHVFGWRKSETKC
ncbi:hypothetical protein HK102_004855 [Quaeritorhiza haematococci]|nr:hypothetical protein HK102_004855 [Quaeritorhiza haematococci]